MDDNFWCTDVLAYRNKTQESRSKIKIRKYHYGGGGRYGRLLCWRPFLWFRAEAAWPLPSISWGSPFGIAWGSSLFDVTISLIRVINHHLL